MTTINPKPPPMLLLMLVRALPQLGPLPPHIMDWWDKPGCYIAVLDDGRKRTYPKSILHIAQPEAQPAGQEAQAADPQASIDPPRPARAAKTTRKGKRECSSRPS